MPAHPFQRCHPCARPHSAHFAPPATPLTNPQAPMKRKTDDCTSLRSSASLISSAPHRHQTCRAEYFTSAHFPDKSAQSAASSPPPSRKWTRTEPLYLRTRVSTFSKERAECRPRHPPTWLSAITRCVSGQRLRPLPTTGAHRLRLSRSRPHASTSSHPKQPALRPRRFGAAPYQGHCIRNPHRTGTSPPRRGERYHHTHSRLHPASRAQTLIRSSGVMRVPSSAPQLPGHRDSARLRRPQTLRPKRKSGSFRHRSSAPASSLRSLAGTFSWCQLKRYIFAA